VVGVVQNFPHGNSRAKLGSMSFRHDHYAGVAAVVVHRDDMVGRAQRKGLTKCRQRLICRRRTHVSAHHLAHRQIAGPADIGGATDRFTAQMEAPGGE
jgi:hypothetical protein